MRGGSCRSEYPTVPLPAICGTEVPVRLHTDTTARTKDGILNGTALGTRIPLLYADLPHRRNHTHTA